MNANNISDIWAKTHPLEGVTAAEIAELLEVDLQIQKQDQPARGFVGFGSQLEWPEAETLGSEIQPVLAFDPALLPESMRPLVEDVAERMQTPPDFPAAVAIVSLAGSTNRRALIQPKANDCSWLVVPNLWVPLWPLQVL